jgi:hypothetical protein
MGNVIQFFIINYCIHSLGAAHELLNDLRKQQCSGFQDSSGSNLGLETKVICGFLQSKEAFTGIAP